MVLNVCFVYVKVGRYRLIPVSEPHHKMSSILRREEQPRKSGDIFETSRVLRHRVRSPIFASSISQSNCWSVCWLFTIEHLN